MKLKSRINTIGDVLCGFRIGMDPDSFPSFGLPNRKSLIEFGCKRRITKGVLVVLIVVVKMNCYAVVMIIRNAGVLKRNFRDLNGFILRLIFAFFAGREVSRHG